MLGIDKHGVAARIRSLLSGGQASLPEWARRLGVGEYALRLSQDEHSPFPTFDVLMAIVRIQGVDPMWLLTGEYDPAKHRVADDRPDDTQQLIARVLAGRLTSRGSSILKS